MITAGEPLEYFPLGREHLRHHPGEVYLPVETVPAAPTASVVDFSADLLRALQGVSLDDQPQREGWFLKESSENDAEDEFYYCGKTVVWSQSSGYGVRKICKSFSLENPVRQVLWANFNTCRMKPRRIDPLAKIPESTNGSFVMSGMCAIELSAVTVFTKSGEDFCTTVPFVVSKAWSCSYGLLFERCVLDTTVPKQDSDNIPIIFSMLHPLDDISPVIKKTGAPSTSKISYFLSNNEQIVFTCSNPSLIVTFNKHEGVHSVWKLRPTTFEEADYACSKVLIDSQFGSSTPINDSSHVTNASGYSRMASHFHTPGNAFSPFRNHGSSRVASPAANQSISFSPAVSNLTPMATLSRSYSPAVNNNVTRRRSYTPLPSYLLHKSPLSPMDSTYECEFLDSLAPDLCFEHEWTEAQSGCNGEAASKVFLSSDVSSHSYLCFHLKTQQQLKLIKLEESNDSRQWIFGTSSLIQAIDAEALPTLNLIVILELNYSLTLYTGLVKVSKVFISDYISMFDFPRTKPHRNRRGSLITSTRPPSPSDATFGEEMVLSPVIPVDVPSKPVRIDDIPLTHTGIIKCLRDAVQNRITLETTTGYYRISLPKITNSETVYTCLKALRIVLPRDIYTQIFVKWYCVRNAPGPNSVTCEAELNAFLMCLLEAIGYDTNELCLGGYLVQDTCSSSSDIFKKPKTSECGCDQDWNYLLTSNFFALVFKNNAHWMGLELNRNFCCKTHIRKHICISAPVFPYIVNVFFAIHLVYEDYKLNVLHFGDLPQLCSFLFEIARDLTLKPYIEHYLKDFPEQFRYVSMKKLLTDEIVEKVHFPSYFAPCPSIYAWIQNALKTGDSNSFPYIPHVTLSLRNIVSTYVLLTEQEYPLLDIEKFLMKVVASGSRVPNEIDTASFLKDIRYICDAKQAAITYLSKTGTTLDDIDVLPVGISFGIRDALFHSRNYTLPEWSEHTYNFIGRQDLMTLHMEETRSIPKKLRSLKSSTDSSKSTNSKENDDGFQFVDHEVIRLRFSKDHRIHNVYRMLQSSKPVRIMITQRPEVSDHEFIEEQERRLYSLCIRTMALPVGRGMFTLRTYTPVVTETLPIPKLCLTGRAPPRNATVDLLHIDVPPNMNMWPLFHNGVAAGLRISTTASQVDSTWMVYNKPRSTTTDTPTEHAGFLMALGLNGHLSNLNVMSIHDYLCKGHELTSVGVLLGVSAAKHGTMDVAVTKLLSIHVEALLPPTSTELDVPPVVQVAAVLGIGLLYQGSGHHHMAEIMLGEIGRPPGPEMEHCVDRESYSLAAGLALGLISFGRGKNVTSITDSPMADQLYYYMVGGHKRPLTGVHKEKHKSPSYQIREGDSVNVDVTSPGATLALGMMFFDSGNQAIADWMTAPDTQFLLDMVRPDFLLLRTVAKGLILWSSVHPSKEWVTSHLSEIVSKNAFRGVSGNAYRSADMDYETMSQAYCNIIAGACFCLGLKFAGSANEEAFETLLNYAKFFFTFTCNSLGDQAGTSTVETCLNITVIALAMVMAGTGDLKVLQFCRHLRSRIQTSGYVLYGSHLATHMALGLLFLGGGRLTLSTSPLAIGAMLCSFYPKFPTHSNDNRYYLQAFYHLYVLAVEPRLIVPRQLETNKAVYTHVHIIFKDTPWYKNVEYTVKAPCLLPELKFLRRVVISDSRYWTIVFDSEKNWHVLSNLLKNGGNLSLKQKAGCLPYSEDPNGFRSLMAQTCITSGVHGFDIKTDAILKFSSDSSALNFALTFLQSVAENKQEKLWQQKVCGLLFECASQEKMDNLPLYIQLIKLVDRLVWKYQSLSMWNLKLLSAYYRCVKRKSEEATLLLNPEFIIATCAKVDKDVQDFGFSNKESLLSFFNEGFNVFNGHSKDFPLILYGFLLYYDLSVAISYQHSLSEDSSLLEFDSEFPQLPATTIAVLYNILHSKKAVFPASVV